ncbi:MAG: lactate racemase domain-containing protein [Dehalococcoidia bacterium]
MSAKAVTVPRQMWFKEGKLRLTFPESWEVVTCLMNGHKVPQITPKQIKAAFDNPIGSSRLKELAKGKNKVAVIFDDISRPTRVADLISYVLKELEAAGIPEGAIRFICATGAHGAHTYQDFQKKLGQKIMDRFPVYNHNVYENCTYVGQTSQGTRLSVNSEVMSRDLKIGIGSVLPHPQSGFGGGGKIVLPGIASIDSIEAFHLLEIKAREGGRVGIVGPGNYLENPMVKDFNEAAKMIGLNLKIDTIINGRGQPCAIFVGEPEAEYYQAVKFAVPHYATKPVPRADVVVVNTYCKGNEAVVGLIIGIQMLLEKGGDLVLIMDCPTGQVVHYLLGSFGGKARGRLFSAVDFQLPWLKRLVALSPQFERSTTDWIAIPNAVWVKTWSEVMDVIKQDFPNGARVAVIPDGTIQYLSAS